MLNLALNARDAMPEGGKLTIETSNAYLDEGIANSTPALRLASTSLLRSPTTVEECLLKQSIAHLNRFSRPKKPAKVSGLGLSQVCGFMKQSEGHVKIYSESGEGTTIKLYLPRRDGSEAAHSADGTGSAPNAVAPKAILIVEDDDGVRQYAI